ncbi:MULTISPECIES: copper resistance protein B [Pseudomonadota]|jgi:copper resistance protein B|nr:MULTISPECIES: copper resistance protein B [Pseudomonadota]ATP19053.1 copper resistance protein B [Sphingobium yanoikuyae]MAB46902.1 copper resistance protein B [Sphingomonadaceae bacterium]MAF61409.1 copper resistance protein B [Blastomonas sp.]MAM38256.1 copper resistance protein B [Erythrobacter sp.]MBS49693.1 copper resistance protein B [Sphingobium sp.]MEA3388762.1 copper resistance protein B [Pseudomonadota bacterium]OHD08537.1 MAG: copper resistance protein CopB [Sphingopyxis sp. RI|tara:strand:+ start:5096 stop:5998 length:903 start_codon:yes stop_codon:yes gene_type:complete
MDGAEGNPHAGHDMPPEPSAAPDPHAGHAMPSAAPMEAHQAHAGHEPGIPDPPVRGPSAAAMGGPDHAADAIFGAAAMAPAREIVRREHGDIKSHNILIDQLEAVIGKGKDGYAWDVQGWYGGDIDKLWLKTEGESHFDDSPESVEAQALWSHALDPWWNLQAGIRHDFRSGPDRTYAVIGVQGLAPYWFEIDSALFLSDKGDVTARIEAEYDQRLTQKLILQPTAELNFSAQDVPELGIGSGLSTAELGLRLRYQFVPEFAPYIGVKYERAFGDTADFRRARAESRGGWNFLIGIRSWF